MVFDNENYANLPIHVQFMTETFCDLLKIMDFCRVGRTNSSVFIHEGWLIGGIPPRPPRPPRKERLSFTCSYFTVENLFDITNAKIYDSNVNMIAYDIVKEWKDRYIVIYKVERVGEQYRIHFVNNDQLQKPL